MSCTVFSGLFLGGVEIAKIGIKHQSINHWNLNINGNNLSAVKQIIIILKI
jgi:hypothetical protein